MWVIQKLEAYLSDKSDTCLPADETANIFLTLALFSQQKNMLLPVFWTCVPLSYRGTLSTLANVFCLGYFIHLHNRYFCSNSCVHVHSSACLHKWASRVPGSLIQRQKVPSDRCAFPSTRYHPDSSAKVLSSLYPLNLLKMMSELQKDVTGWKGFCGLVWGPEQHLHAWSCYRRAGLHVKMRLEIFKAMKIIISIWL